MPNRIHTRRSAEQPAPASSLHAAVDRPKRIDAYIDYFASGDRRVTGIPADACGETLLDGDAR